MGLVGRATAQLATGGTHNARVVIRSVSRDRSLGGSRRATLANAAMRLLNGRGETCSRCCFNGVQRSSTMAAGAGKGIREEA